MLELASIVILGILAQWIAWRIRVPAILPLIIIGLFVGPISSLWTPDGQKIIEPIYDASTDKGFFPGQSLFYFVSLAIGIILFEGGLTLKRREITETAPVIAKLITIGSIVSFVGGGLAAHFILDLNPSLAFLFGGLIIVTGPTVIVPILQNVPLTRNVASVLKWEGILIDPIGALVAVLVYGFIVAGEADQGGYTVTALVIFGKILVTGFSIGVGAAYGLYLLLKKDLIPHYLLNVFTLALVLAAFVISDVLEHESGLLTVVVMGMVLGNMKVPQLGSILDFKESLTVLLISILFILLSANIDIEQLQMLGGPALIVFAIVVLVLRPLGVFLSTIGSNLNLREKLFISWIGPRGIVAAGIASLFGIRLVKAEYLPDVIREQAELITPLTFLVVLGTVLLNATTARLVARVLGVTQAESDGVLIVGANRGARILAKYLQENGRHVVLVDRSAQLVEEAEASGLEVIKEDIFSEDLEERYELLDMGYLLALTSSSEVNKFACQKLQKNFGENGHYRLITNQEREQALANIPPIALFSSTCDFLSFDETARDYPAINEAEIHSLDDFRIHLKKINEAKYSIPLFIKSRKDGDLQVITAHHENIQVEAGDLLVYMGQKQLFNGENTPEA